MISEIVNIKVKTATFNREALNRNSWLVLLHANRVPPHVGLLINGTYNSLTMKGHELNVSVEALLKTISQKKIESIFIKLIDHPVFSLSHQLAIFQEMIKTFEQVGQNKSTCLSPIKLFFQEFYAVNNINEELLFDFVDRLNKNSYLEFAFAQNFEINLNYIELPSYTEEILNEKIMTERLPYFKE